jgi:threonyl-tRNA synthetase
LVEDYNHTPHNAFYGISSLIYKRRDLERYFIKENKYKLERINQMQEESNLKDYKPGNILLIHFDFTKTAIDLSRNEEHLTNLLNLFLMILEM